MNQELREAVKHFVGMFELVFDNDWEMSKLCLDEDNRQYYIQDNGTFINPRVEDEYNNWSNRGHLLKSYRTLKAILDDDVDWPESL